MVITERILVGHLESTSNRIVRSERECQAFNNPFNATKPHFVALDDVSCSPGEALLSWGYLFCPRL
uniref:Uncharacterized protein n=1 Tax=Mesocestoides corti TaxID=53468 RepID=A0A5K3ERA0_MESCO